ncbi:MAG: hydroxyisourate hydrolase [Thermomicrobiales bacterium]|nr:hydroxyisourate hydrolase [Thermomicrobiales bacterium]
MTSGRLTTHVLDTAHGRPAAGITILLWAIEPDGDRSLVARTRTNADGRTDGPLLEGAALRTGVYELEFATGDYWAAHGSGGDALPFLDLIPIRFGVADPDAHYHVPLLCSPWSYTTYRGS